MRIIFLVFISLLANAGQPIFRTSFLGAEHGYRGHDVWLRVAMTWYNAEPATVDPATDYITVPSRTYNGLESLVLVSDGTLPSAVNRYRGYKACFINGNRFKFVAESVGGCGSEVNFTDTGSGQLYVAMAGTGPSTPAMKNITLPPGVTLTEVLGGNGLPMNPSASGKYFGFTTFAQFYLHLQIAPDAPLTPGTASITVELAGVNTVYTKPFQVRELNPVRITRPTSFPPIPAKSTWESKMLIGAAKWCNKSTGVLSGGGVMLFGVESQVWFYDGSWVYRQIAAHTGDQEWLNCAQSIISQYRDYILANGSAPGYRIFTDGLKSECQSCDGRYKFAIKQLADNGPFTLLGGSPRDDLDRETSFLLEAALNAAIAYGYTSLDKIPTTGTWPRIKANILRASTMLLGILDTKRNDNYIYNQTFMTGIVMRALIRYWEYTGDPRVPAEVKDTLDFIWDRLWLPASPPNKLIYNIAPRGARCDYSCFPYAETTLINLTVPAFAWYWSITGDDLYRQRGDTIFSHAFDEPMDFSGKVTSQNYRWSFDYIYWREGKAPFRP